MNKVKYFIITIISIIAIMMIPGIVNAESKVTVTRNIYSNLGSMKFTFKGLKLDMTHEYLFGLTKTVAEEIKSWFSITEYTESNAVVDVTTTTRELRNVINAVDKGYITIKDKTTDTIVLKPYGVDLKIPFLRVTNYTVIPNGKEFDPSGERVQLAIRNAHNSNIYYQYEKITDENIIKKYKEIKKANGDFLELENLLKTVPPESNWTEWALWSGHDFQTGMNGYGYPERRVSVPDSGLYYMWVYNSGNNLKNIYGYILVDNLQPDINLEAISLPATEKVELGKTLTLKPTFNPSNATNKIVKWSSSNEDVATVDNGGKVTPKKLGSTVITVISEDGNRKATCTVTVVAKQENNNGNSGSNNSGNNNNGGNTGNNNNQNNGSQNNSGGFGNNQNDKKDPTVADKEIPQTGEKIVVAGLTALTGIVVLGIVAYHNERKLKDIK